MSQLTRLGILGGTFDPIHIGHLAMAQAVLETMKLDKIFFVPCHLPPRKSARGVTAAVHRYEMVRRAIQGNPGFAVSPFEKENPGRSYTIDTVRHFARKFPGARLFFAIGADAYTSLGTWKDINGILGIVDFVVVNRPGDAPPLLSCDSKTRGRTGRGIRHLSVVMPGMDISSSYIRQCVRWGKSIRYFVPQGVLRYIENHKLYQAQ